MANKKTLEAPLEDATSALQDITEPAPAEDQSVAEATEIQASAVSVEINEDSDVVTEISVGAVDPDVALSVQMTARVIPATDAHPELPL